MLAASDIYEHPECSDSYVWGPDEKGSSQKMRVLSILGAVSVVATVSTVMLSQAMGVLDLGSYRCVRVLSRTEQILTSPQYVAAHRHLSQYRYCRQLPTILLFRHFNHWNLHPFRIQIILPFVFPVFCRCVILPSVNVFSVPPRFLFVMTATMPITS